MRDSYLISPYNIITMSRGSVKHAGYEKKTDDQ